MSTPSIAIRADLEGIAYDAFIRGDNNTDLLVALLLEPAPLNCITCNRRTPQRNGDPDAGQCPRCGSTLGRWMDDGSRVPPWSMTSFSVEIKGTQ